MAYRFHSDWYLKSKLAQLTASGEVDANGQDYTEETLTQAIHAAGMTLEEHYHRYSSYEGTSAISPIHFDEAYYLQSKLAQLAEIRAKDANGLPYTTTTLIEAIRHADLTVEEHYLKFHTREGTSASPYFNTSEYLQGKLLQLQHNLNARVAAEWANKTIDDVAKAIMDAGMSAEEHYLRFGSHETDKDGKLINPSNAFDANAYMSAKLLELQSSHDPSIASIWAKANAADVAKAIAKAGLNPVTHYEHFGAEEANKAGFAFLQTVPVAERVANDPIRAMTGENIPANYNAPSKAPSEVTKGQAPIKPCDLGGLANTQISPTPSLPSDPIPTPYDPEFVALPKEGLLDTNANPVALVTLSVENDSGKTINLARYGIETKTLNADGTTIRNILPVSANGKADSSANPLLTEEIQSDGSSTTTITLKDSAGNTLSEITKKDAKGEGTTERSATLLNGTTITEEATCAIAESGEETTESHIVITGFDGAVTDIAAKTVVSKEGQLATTERVTTLKNSAGAQTGVIEEKSFEQKNDDGTISRGSEIVTKNSAGETLLTQKSEASFVKDANGTNQLKTTTESTYANGTSDTLVSTQSVSRSADGILRTETRATLIDAEGHVTESTDLSYASVNASGSYVTTITKESQTHDAQGKVLATENGSIVVTEYSDGGVTETRDITSRDMEAGTRTVERTMSSYDPETNETTTTGTITVHGGNDSETTSFINTKDKGNTTDGNGGSGASADAEPVADTNEGSGTGGSGGGNGQGSGGGAAKDPCTAILDDTSNALTLSGKAQGKVYIDLDAATDAVKDDSGTVYLDSAIPVQAIDAAKLQASGVSIDGPSTGFETRANPFVLVAPKNGTPITLNLVDDQTDTVAIQNAQAGQVTVTSFALGSTNHNDSVSGTFSLEGGPMVQDGVLTSNSAGTIVTIGQGEGANVTLSGTLLPQGIPTLAVADGTTLLLKPSIQIADNTTLDLGTTGAQHISLTSEAFNALSAIIDSKEDTITITGGTAPVILTQTLNGTLSAPQGTTLAIRKTDLDLTKMGPEGNGAGLSATFTTLDLQDDTTETLTLSPDQLIQFSSITGDAELSGTTSRAADTIIVSGSLGTRDQHALLSGFEGNIELSSGDNYLRLEKSFTGTIVGKGTLGDTIHIAACGTNALMIGDITAEGETGSGGIAGSTIDFSAENARGAVSATISAKTSATISAGNYGDTYLLSPNAATGATASYSVTLGSGNDTILFNNTQANAGKTILTINAADCVHDTAKISLDVLEELTKANAVSVINAAFASSISTDSVTTYSLYANDALNAEALGQIFVAGDDMYTILGGARSYADGQFEDTETVLKVTGVGSATDIVAKIRSFFGQDPLATVTETFVNSTGTLTANQEVSDNVAIELSDRSYNYAKVTVGNGTVQSASGAGTALRAINTENMKGAVTITGLSAADKNSDFALTQDAYTSRVTIDVTGAPKNVAITGGESTKTIVTGTLGTKGVSGTFSFDKDGIMGTGNSDSISVANGTLSKNGDTVSYAATASVDAGNLIGSLSAFSDASILALKGAMNVTLSNIEDNSLTKITCESGSAQKIEIDSTSFNTLSGGIILNNINDKIIITDTDADVKLSTGISTGKLSANLGNGTIHAVSQNASIYGLAGTSSTTGMDGFTKLLVDSNSVISMRSSQFLSFRDLNVISSDKGKIILYANPAGGDLGTLSLGTSEHYDYSNFYGIVEAACSTTEPELRVTNNSNRTVDLSHIELKGFSTLHLGGGTGENTTEQSIKLLSKSFVDISSVESDSTNDRIILSDTDSATLEIGSKFSEFTGILSSTDDIVHTLTITNSSLDLSSDQSMSFGSNFNLSINDDNSSAQTILLTSDKFKKFDHSDNSISMGANDTISLSDTIADYVVNSSIKGTIKLANGGNTVKLSQFGMVESGIGSDSITTSGDGNTIIYSSKEASTLSSMDWIKNFGSNDKLDLSALSYTESNFSANIQNKVNEEASLDAALNAAAEGNTLDNGLLWFTYNDASYVYIEENGSDSTYANSDLVIKITGTSDSIADEISINSFV